MTYSVGYVALGNGLNGHKVKWRDCRVSNSFIDTGNYEEKRRADYEEEPYIPASSIGALGTHSLHGTVVVLQKTIKYKIQITKDKQENTTQRHPSYGYDQCILISANGLTHLKNSIPC